MRKGCVARPFGRILIPVFLAIIFFSSSSSSHSLLNGNFLSNSTFFFQPPPQKEYIVMFDSYMSCSGHKQALDAALKGFEGHWHLLKRNNPAALLPSDFALISVDNDAIVQRLEGQLHVRYVIPERRIVNPLKGQEDSLEGDIFNTTHITAGKYTRGFPTISNEEVPSHLPGTRRLHSSVFQVTDLFNTNVLWDKMYTGTGVRVAIFDTGLRPDHPHFKNVKGITNWTNEDSVEDGLGHGTFVAGVVASQSECLGFAPDADLFIYRVFTNNRVSYTSWFLDAFNHALQTDIDILNLSIGGPDFMDRPFVEKVWELSANGVIVVSAIGNDGPLYGTLNNPADQLDVIGVGGIDYGEKVASFSSRGMTTWELPSGYGRVKPDILAYGQSVQGSRIHGGCRALSGTSVASPVVAGAITLLASTVPKADRKRLVTPASIKQVLLESAERVPGANIFEQGYGKLNLLGAYQALSQYEPHVSLAPPQLDFTDCPYMWPFCSQPLYAGALPVVFNVTILNGLDVSGTIVEPGPTWVPGKNGEYLKVGFSYSKTLWPWTGHIAVHITVSPQAAAWEGIVEGTVVFTVSSGPGMSQRLELPVRAKVVPTPPRFRRLLWDQFHNLQYPAGYFPRDVLDKRDELFDWNGDHPHTNFHGFYTHLRELGYYIEILGSPYSCFDPEKYGALLIIDPEDEFYAAEIEKLREDVVDHGLSVIVVADWYNVDVLNKIKFYDDNARQWWIPATGGSNVPALNELLSGFGILLGDRIYDGDFSVGGNVATYSSGSSIVNFPEGGYLVQFPLMDQTAQILRSRSEKNPSVPILGLYTPPANLTANSTFNDNDTDVWQSANTPGTIAVFGDSSCLDDATGKTPCYWLLERILRITNRHATVESEFATVEHLEESYHQEGPSVTRLKEGTSFAKFSHVVGKPLTCSNVANLERTYLWEDKSNLTSVEWKERPTPVRNTRHGWDPFGSSTMRSSVTSMPPFLVFICVLLVVIFIIVAFMRVRDAASKGRGGSPLTPKRVLV